MIYLDPRKTKLVFVISFQVIKAQYDIKQLDIPIKFRRIIEKKLNKTDFDWQPFVLTGLVYCGGYFTATQSKTLLKLGFSRYNRFIRNLPEIIWWQDIISWAINQGKANDR